MKNMALLSTKEISKEEFYKKVHADGIIFRKQMVKKFLDKPEDQRDESDLSIIKQWAETYGEEAW